MIRAHWTSLIFGFGAAVLGVLLMWGLQSGWYYYHVLQWVDQVRINSLQEAAKAKPAGPQ